MDNPLQAVGAAWGRKIFTPQLELRRSSMKYAYISDLHPSVALADYIKDIKVSSSKWMKESGFFPYFRG